MSSEAVLLSVSNCILDSQNPTLQFVTASPVASTTLGTFISLANSATETPGSTDEAATCECIHNDACSVPISEKIIRPDNHFQRRLQKMRTTSLSTTGRYLAALSRGGGSFLSPDMESLEANPVTAEHMQKLIGGYARFRKTYSGKWKNLFEKLKTGQSPKIALIGCCDSRVDPAIITDCEPGDLFIIRNVANLVPPYNPDPHHHGVSAAIEFAVKKLHVDCIIVLGHSQCGGIELLMKMDQHSKNQACESAHEREGRAENDDNKMDFLESWVLTAQKAKEKTQQYFADATPERQRLACEHASILHSLENLMLYPWVRSRVEANHLTLYGWYFDFITGELMGYDPEKQSFCNILDVNTDELSNLSLNLSS